MVTIKRYIGKVKKPLHWRGRRHFLRNVVLPSVTAVLLLLAVRTLLLTQFSLSDNLPASGLLEGDRILVDRTAYGVRNPLPASSAPTAGDEACRNTAKQPYGLRPKAPEACDWDASQPCRATR